MAFLFCEKNFIGFLAELDNSKSFRFLAFFGLVAFIKAQRPNFFVVSQITFHFASNEYIRIGIGPNTKILHFAKS